MMTPAISRARPRRVTEYATLDTRRGNVQYMFLVSLALGKCERLGSKADVFMLDEKVTLTL